MLTGVIPAAGLGSRLGLHGPKALAHLLGRPLISYVLRAMQPFVDHLVIVVRPGDEEMFSREVAGCNWGGPLSVVVQDVPSGSAAAVAIGMEASPPGSDCIICWSDQVGIYGGTVARVADRLNSSGKLVLPLVEVAEPYVWVHFGDDNLVAGVGRRRDGDVSPAYGLADLGLFGLSREVGLLVLNDCSQKVGEDDREQDFVYLLPQLSRKCGLEALIIDDATQAVAVNTPEDLTKAEAVLGGRKW